MSIGRELYKSLLKRYQWEIQSNKSTLLIYFKNSVGIGEHPDITEAMQQEIDKIARWHDQIEVINHYIKKK